MHISARIDRKLGIAYNDGMMEGLELYHNSKKQDDYYATDPKATELLLDIEKFNSNIWECACGGGGHIGKVLEQAGYNVWSTE